MFSLTQSQFKHVSCKLGNMRKAVEWTVCPNNEAGSITIQCNRRIARIDLETGEGMLSESHNYPTFMTLSPLMGAKPIQVAGELLEELRGVV